MSPFVKCHISTNYLFQSVANFLFYLKLTDLHKVYELLIEIFHRIEITLVLLKSTEYTYVNIAH